MSSLFTSKSRVLSSILAVMLLAGCAPNNPNASPVGMRMDQSAPMMNCKTRPKCQHMCPNCEGMCPLSGDMQDHSMMSDGDSSTATPMDHSAHSSTAKSNIYAPVMAKMHTAMTMAGSGNSDVDFMRGMIPHHQGAIDMAHIALANSSDPTVRKLATEIIDAQKSEISLMQQWLQNHQAHH